ncbi:MAG: hypothetical protein ACI808_001832 [Paraglaciecola sp.]|jgi:hypothetical protein
MNRSSKGFGLASVLATVVLLIVVAIFSAPARSITLSHDTPPNLDSMFSQVDSLK